MIQISANGRIDGKRVTIYDVYHYLDGGWSPEEITSALPLTVEQVEAAARYIEGHREEVLAVHRQIEERIARGNPPGVAALRAQSRRKMASWLDERRRQEQERNGARLTG